MLFIVERGYPSNDLASIIFKNPSYGFPRSESFVGGWILNRFNILVQWTDPLRLIAVKPDWKVQKFKSVGRSKDFLDGHAVGMNPGPIK